MAAALETIDTMITTDLEPPEARGWLVASADRVLQPLGLRRRETATAAIYRPEPRRPLAAWAVRRLRGEELTISFHSQGEGTLVHVKGRLSEREHEQVSDLVQTWAA